MGMNNVNAIRGQGALGRPLTGKDFISGLCLFSDTPPAAFAGSGQNIKMFLSLAEAEAAGIKADYADETATIETFEVTAVGATGDKIDWYFEVPSQPGSGGKHVFLGTYVQQAGDNAAAVVAGSVAAINALTYKHGFAAAVNGTSTSKIDIEAAPGYGIWANSGFNGAYFVITGGITIGAKVLKTTGVFSKNAIYHYHIQRYFKKQPKGKLYVGMFPVTANAWDFVEMATMQNYAQGDINLLGVYIDEIDSWDTSDMTAMQVVLDALEVTHKPISWAFYGADIAGLTVSTMSGPSYNGNNFTCSGVTPTIGQDAAARGWFLFQTSGVTIGTIGADLGAGALSTVSESIANPENFRMDDGNEFDALMFGTGEYYKAIQALTPLTPDVVMDALNDNRFMFLRKFDPDYQGSFYNDNMTYVSSSSDYSHGNDNRTIFKGIKLVRGVMIPKLSSKFKLKSDGTLPDTKIEYFISICRRVLQVNMVDVDDLSELPDDAITIDPLQLVNVTGFLSVAVKLRQEAIARNINVPIGYTI
ncbi:hypothetical protein UFOVP1596_2 [uncultured Caudovirales phage]|uniref:Tail sheath protein n=1 Tax=uncultured Caudovirales phage TaxID=2100421 RepID=A0A6J5SS34_9CAUD|nr:hypothetical protein UFOVP1596_2 [uncultured Caudovirales phage]